MEAQRRRLVEQLRARGIRDERVLEAFGAVPRERFVGPGLAGSAYEDAPLPIGEGQTISQPFMVAVMIEAARCSSHDRVLDVGTGSGYAAAVLDEVAGDVYTIERHAPLLEAARRAFAATGHEGIRTRQGDGSQGWPEAAPFDAIVVAAAGPHVPESLKRQLAVGGRLVLPVGATPRQQRLLRVTRTGIDDWHEEELGAVRFVPLVGKEGFDEAVGGRGPRPPPGGGRDHDRHGSRTGPRHGGDRHGRRTSLGGRTGAGGPLGRDSVSRPPSD